MHQLWPRMNEATFSGHKIKRNTTIGHWIIKNIEAALHIASRLSEMVRQCHRNQHQYKEIAFTADNNYTAFQKGNSSRSPYNLVNKAAAQVLVVK